MIFEIPQQGFQLLFHLADFLLLLALALRGKTSPFATELFFFAAQLRALGLLMQLIEKSPHVPRLRAEPRASALHDLRIQPQPLRDIDPCRRAGDAGFQLVRRFQCRFIESHRSIEHAC